MVSEEVLIMSNVLDELWSGRTLVLSHRNADIDAMGS